MDGGDVTIALSRDDSLFDALVEILPFDTWWGISSDEGILIWNVGNVDFPIRARVDTWGDQTFSHEGSNTLRLTASGPIARRREAVRSWTAPTAGRRARGS